jgi:predicted anti-sigma-YlaC factor YlaD
MERQRSTIHLSCQDVSRLLSDRHDASLPAADRARLRLHLVICQTCRNVSEQMDFLRRAMRRLDPDHADPKPTDEPERGT